MEMKVVVKREKFDDHQVIEIYDYESTSVSSTAQTHGEDKNKGTTVQKKNWLDYLEHAPKYIGAAVFISVIGFALYDWRQMIEIFKALIEWVKLEPIKSAVVIYFVYILLILFSMPIVFFSVPLGYAFHLAFEGKFSKVIYAFKLAYSRLCFRFSRPLLWNNLRWNLGIFIK